MVIEFVAELGVGSGFLDFGGAFKWEVDIDFELKKFGRGHQNCDLDKVDREKESEKIKVHPDLDL